jgi:N-acyl-D-amino-acid deacylase
MDSYLKRVEKQGVALNIAPVVGHGTVRQNVLGYENREPTGNELEEMKKLVSEAMKDGAWGISTGLIYPPSVYGKQPEITELVKVVAEFSGVYFSHIRGEGDTLLEAITEACEIGIDSGAPVQIAHFKASGKQNWGRTKESLALVEKYREIDVEVTFDQYPYIASSTNLTAMLPHWSQEGGAEMLMEYLQDPITREKLAKEMRLNYGWTSVLVTNAKNNPQYNGKNIQEVADMMNKDVLTAFFDLLVLENTQVPSVMFGMNEEDVKRVMQSPYGMVGSDGSAIAPTGIWENNVPHPRLYGTFPRVLGHYARDERVISLQEAVRKMTGAPAQKLGLKERGLLREGYKADITVFNPKTVKDIASFNDPQQYPAGIPYVIVNGKIVIKDGEHTGVLPGKALRKRWA